jgi:hypothetical protein
MFQIALNSMCRDGHKLNRITRPLGNLNVNASQSPLDAEWGYEVANAVMKAGLDKQSAGDLLLKISEKLKGREIETPYYDTREFYDMVHHKPLPNYERAYLNVKEEISALGLQFD